MHPAVACSGYHEEEGRRSKEKVRAMGKSKSGKETPKPCTQEKNNCLNPTGVMQGYRISEKYVRDKHFSSPRHSI